MKKLLFVIIVLMANTVIFAGSHKAIKLDKSLEDGTVLNDSKQHQIVYGNSSAIDTSRRVPGLTSWWDYWTNGNNQRMVSVLGDTVIVANAFIDSANASTSTGRIIYYQVSYNGGLTWLSEPVLLAPLPLGGAYPDIVPVVLSGARTVTITGRQFSPGSRGFAGTDVILGAGSFTNTITPGTGTDYFSCWLSSTEVGGVYQTSSSDNTLNFVKYNYVTNSFGTPITVAAATTEIDANARKMVASSTNGQDVFAIWYVSTAGSEKISGKRSTNGGTSFGSASTIMPAAYNAGGDLVDPWFGFDVTYKPNTTTVGVVFNTQPNAATGAAQGWKVMYWSPGINGGNAVVIADWKNTPVLADTGYINNPNLVSSIQVGMTGLSHPTLAWSNDGSRLYCVFSGIQKDTTTYGFFYNDLYSSYSTNDGASWSTPVKLSGMQQFDDEIYPVLSKTGNTAGSFGLLFMLSSYPGSASFTNTGTPRSRSYAVYTRIDPITGNQIPIGINTISSEIPNSFSLEQNYPNPFNPATTIRFDIAKASNVNIKIFDITGRLVEQVVADELVPAGTHEVKFNASRLSSGVYFYTLEADGFKQTRKMMLVK